MLPHGIREETVSEAATTEGDCTFLETALQALADQRKLLGLNAPRQIDHTLAEKKRPLERLTDEELHEMLTRNRELLADAHWTPEQRRARGFKITH